MPRYVIRGGEAGFERLQVLAALRLPDTATVLDLIGVRAGWHCADLGTGSGDFAFELARRAGAAGRVEAFDMDEVKLGLAAAEAARRGLTTVGFEAADLTTWSRPACYDLVFCSLVLQHLVAPGDLVDRAWAAVRPGGWLFLEDADFDGLHCYPDDPGFTFYADTYTEVLRRRGGDPQVGRKLVQLVLAAGAPDPQVRLTQRAGRVGLEKSMALRTLEAVADAVVDEGVADAEQVLAAIEHLRAFSADATTLVAGPRNYQVWAQRPADAAQMGMT